MSLPTPTENENEKEFISRCMSDAEAVRDYPDEKQRLAFCNSFYLNKSQNKDKINNMSNEFVSSSDIVKVDDNLGIVFGYAMVSKVDGQDYYDSHGDNITEKAMLDACTDFMKNSRVAKDMHQGDQIGDIVFMFPLTTDIAKALDITAKRTGVIIGMQPSKDVLQKFKNGTYTGFSIGGKRAQDEIDGKVVNYD